MSSLPTNDTIYQSIHTSMCGTKPAEESNTKLPTKRWILYDTCLPHNPQNRVIFADKICPKAGRLDRQSKSQNSKFFKKLLCNQKWCQNSKWDIFGLRLFSNSFFYIFPPKNSIRIMNALFFCLKLVNHGAKLHLECIINLFSNMCNLLEFNECFCLDRPDVHTLKMVPLLLESHRFFTNIDRKSVESYAC